MSRFWSYRSAAAILLALAAGCSDQPPAAPPAAADVQASETPSKAGKASKAKEVRAPGPSTTLTE